jgi:DNA-binding CsgD family transcriptional regulator
MLDDRVVSTFIGDLYEAAVEPALWDGLLARLAGACNGHAAVLYQFDRTQLRAEFVGTMGVDPRFVADYEQHFSKIDVWNERAMKRQPVGLAGATHELITDAEFERTEFYNDHLRHVGIFYGAGGIIERTPLSMAICGVQRGRRFGAFAPDELRLFTALFPHFRRGLLIRRELAFTVPRAALVETLDRLREGVIIVDGRGRAIFLNRIAETILADGRGLCLEKGRLAGSTPSQTAALDGSLQSAIDAANGRGIASGGTVILRGPDGAAPLRVTVSPLRGPLAGLSAPSAVLFIHDSALDRAPMDALRRRYHLTAAETRVLAALFQGKTAKTVAGEHGVSVNTVRVQIQRLFAKTGLHRQTDLIRLAAGMGLAEGVAAKEEAPARPPSRPKRGPSTRANKSGPRSS